MCSFKKLVVAGVFLMLSGNTKAIAFEKEQISIPGSVAVSASDINDHNVIVGYFTVGDSFSRGFRYNLVTKQIDKFETVSGLANDESYACAINNAGDIVGMSGQFPFQTFILPANTSSLEDISVVAPQIDKCIAAGVTPQRINDAGVIAGWQLYACEDDQDFIRPMSYLTKDRSLELQYPKNGGGFSQDINSRGSIVGYKYKKQGNTSAVVWQLNKKKDAKNNFKQVTLFSKSKNTSDSFAWGINDKETVVGSYYRNKKFQQAYTWTKKKGVKNINLGKLKAKASIAKAINNQNVIVGLYKRKSKTYRAFVYKKGVGAFDLGVRSRPLEQIDVTAINDQGVVVVSSGTKSYAVHTNNLRKVKKYKNKSSHSKKKSEKKDKKRK